MMHIPMTIVQPFTRRNEAANTSLDALRIKMAVQLASEETGISKAEIMGDSRRADVAAARQLAFAKCREMGMSYPAIGRGFGRDHTTVMHGVRKHRGAV